MFQVMFHNFFIVHDIRQTLNFTKIKWDNSSMLSKYFCHELFKLTPFMNSKLGNFLNFFLLIAVFVWISQSKLY